MRWALPLLASLLGAAPAHELPLDVAQWRIIPTESGPVNYYRTVVTPTERLIHAAYVPPTKTAVLGFPLKGVDAHGATLAWRWRALQLPVGGNECEKGKADSAALVFVAWRQGLKWYTVKYVWSSTLPVGTRCNHKDNFLRAEETVVLESGAAHLGQWVPESLSLDAEYRRAFAGNRPQASVPPLTGLAVFTDGDQTRSAAAADFADFRLIHP